MGKPERYFNGSSNGRGLTNGPALVNNAKQSNQPSEAQFLRLIRGRVAKGTQEELAKVLSAINNRLACIERQTPEKADAAKGSF